MRKRYIIWLAVIGLIIFSFNLQNKLFWDDDDWIINNKYVHDFSHVKEIFSENILGGVGLNSNYYRPLLLLSFAVNYKIGQTGPLTYHLVSNGFHISNAILIFLILAVILKRKTAAFVAALLFLVHPVTIEAVAYISGRGDPMSVFFILLALWLFINATKALILRNRMLLWAGSLASMALAILSRETAVLLPGFVFLVSFCFLSEGRTFLKSFLLSFARTLPYVAISAIYASLRLTILNFENTLNFYNQANIYTEHLFYRLFTFGRALIDYFLMLLWPLGLHMERTIPVYTSLWQWPVWLALILVVTMVYLVVRQYRRGNRIWLFAWGWFFIGLAPVSGIVPINALIYEHWLYLPLIGLATLVGFYFDRALVYFREKRNMRDALIFGLSVYIIFFSAVSIQRNIAWGNETKFYEDILKYNPESIRILNNLGNIYSSQGDLEKAASMFRQAIQTDDSFPQPHYNLGNIYRDTGHIDEAISEYLKAIQIDPAFPFAYQNLLYAYKKKGDLKSAQAVIDKYNFLFK